MTITEKNAQGLIRQFDFSISPDEIEHKMIEQLEKINRTKKMPGFRPGKIPLTILKQHYGSAIKNEVIEKALNSRIDQIIDQYKLRPALEPKKTLDPYQDGQEIKGHVEFEVMPEIESVDFKKFKFDYFESETKSSRIDEVIERLRMENFQSESLDDAQKVENDHVVHLSFKGIKEDGNPIIG